MEFIIMSKAKVEESVQKSACEQYKGFLEKFLSTQCNQGKGSVEYASSHKLSDCETANIQRKFWRDLCKAERLEKQPVSPIKK
jgi:hypothetical protein